jgi:polar amino acid transport system substrate-binding protein
MLPTGLIVVAVAGSYLRSPPLPDVRDWPVYGAAEGGQRVDRVEDESYLRTWEAQLRPTLRVVPRVGAYATALLGIALLFLALPLLYQIVRHSPASGREEITQGKEQEPIAMRKPENVSQSRWLIALVVLVVCATAGFAAWRHFNAHPLPGDVLRWGGDSSGGAPYIIDKGPGREPSGFEAELAQYLAGKLGLESQYVNKDWDKLPDDLRRGDLDVVLNGYEWLPEREKAMASTVPYYAYKLRLVVRRDSPLAESKTPWEDLGKPDAFGRKYTVGVLGQSAAHRYVEERYEDAVDVLDLGTEGTTGVMLKVQNKDPKDAAARGPDATVQDVPAVVWYLDKAKEFPNLRAVGEAIKPFPHSYYVGFVRHEDKELRERLTQAILDGIRDGKLKAIYERYGLWDQDQENLAEAAVNWPPPIPESEWGWWDYGWILLRAARWTVLLACASMPLAMLVGLLVALGRLYGPRWLDGILTVYVEFLRGTPVLLQLVAIYYVLPNVPYLHLNLDPFTAGVLGLAINYSAYEAENYRAGLQAIPRGQMEAALSLGMSTWTALRRVIVPQAVRVVIPPVTNDFIALFKDTSICGVIGVFELTKSYRDLGVNHPNDVVALGVMTALLYLLMSYPLSVLARRLERRFSRTAS